MKNSKIVFKRLKYFYETHQIHIHKYLENNLVYNYFHSKIKENYFNKKQVLYR